MTHLNEVVAKNKKGLKQLQGKNMRCQIGRVEKRWQCSLGQINTGNSLL